jgi:membrane associated rhomboid family serine protease
MRYYEATPYFERSLRPKTLSVTTILIITCCIIFVLQLLCWRFLGLDLCLSLGLVPQDAIQRLHFWQFFTYMFLHAPSDIFHILINMLILYIFGRELEASTGRKRFLQIYIICGMYAGLCYVVYRYIVGGIGYPTIGASGAIMGVMVVFAMMWPHRTILFFFIIPMKVWVCVLIFLGIDLLYMVTQFEGDVAHAAHLGGALCGFLIYRLGPWIEELRLKIDQKRAQREYLKRAKLRKEVDRILERISTHGMQSLTPREKRILKSASKVFKHY